MRKTDQIAVFLPLVIAIAVALGTALIGGPGTAPLAAAGPMDRPAKLPDGRTLNFWCSGYGKPTVILESGWSGDSRGWGRVIGPLAEKMRVCAYDRAGYGRSIGAPLPRDGLAVARDLDRGLRALQIDGPFILVGHSAGGLYMRHFYQRRPSDVAGIVLVDSTIENQQRRLEEAFGHGAGSLDPLIKRAGMCLAAARAGPISKDDPVLARCAGDPADQAVERWAARLSELETLFGATSSRLDAAPQPYGDLPLIVLAAGRTYPAPPAVRMWAALQAEVASKSTRGEMRFVPDAGHLMMNDRPDAIITAVRDVAAMAKETGKAPAPKP